MMHDETYRKYYIPSHTNAGCYILGMINGYMFKRATINNFDLSKYKVGWATKCRRTPSMIFLISDIQIRVSFRIATGRFSHINWKYFLFE